MSRKVLVWRMTMMGVVLHAVRSDGTNHAMGAALCGRVSADGIWHYAKGRSWGASYERCSACRRVAQRLAATPPAPELAGGLTPEGDSDYMCPNCVTPWKCNGPHIPEGGLDPDGIGARFTPPTPEPLAAWTPETRDATYERRVKEVAAALHQDCVLEWQAISVVDPGRAITMHMADAHYVKAHDLVRRLWPELDAARLATPAPSEEEQ